MGVSSKQGLSKKATFNIKDEDRDFWTGKGIEIKLPDKKLVDAVKEVHENGGPTGSLGCSTTESSRKSWSAS